MTAMGRKGWSDPSKAAAMIARIPMGRFAGDSYNAYTKYVICDKCLSIAIRSILNDRNPTNQVRILLCKLLNSIILWPHKFLRFCLLVHVTLVWLYITRDKVLVPKVSTQIDYLDAIIGISWTRLIYVWVISSWPGFGEGLCCYHKRRLQMTSLFFAAKTYISSANLNIAHTWSCLLFY